MSNLITVSTDFGYKDWFVAAVKAKIIKINPRARIIDITHNINSHDIRAAAFLLMCVCRNFPKGTVHLAVVDPGVGSARKPLIIASGGHYFVGPDNGIFSYVCQRKCDAFTIVRRSPRVSSTFHGRDIFAPVAAKLSSGVKPSTLGVRSERFLRLTFPAINKEKRSVRGEVIYIDRFGNLITNIPNRLMFKRLRIKGRYSMPVGQCYNRVPAGKLIAVQGSCGYYEIASYKGDAAKITNAKVGTKVGGYF